MTIRRDFTNILLTGASGELGSALALHHARPGTSLTLWGRDLSKLRSITSKVDERGADARSFSHDLMDIEGAVEAVIEQDRRATFDLAYLAAGIGDTRGSGELVEDPSTVHRTAQVNFTAPASMAAALARRMAERGGGRIVLIGSAAGHHSLPFAAAYSGSKAGLAKFSDALRVAVEPHGVIVTLAAPGFLDTAAARANSDKRPMELSVDEAARRIANAAEKGKRHYVTPWPFVLLKALDPMLPSGLRDRLLRSLES
ncbi:SDR family NAD(P)-dependent oxidoreductase [Erythrobacter rubeus]|uniref:SDR family NAD(P)-dependent oxidoreductase n=1 Tax=Erythrobacter rubeus TaxID=2760803 RepID=A0ABR8KP67_9SPHN|nr:SDR family NAD(P)-dependent oxidoreductase [Erythrobacter rubeus]MBD2841055.1 SDR family NAD(P)-dependent oxidoreductase [Erythrobacter rubeus]